MNRKVLFNMAPKGASERGGLTAGSRRAVTASIGQHNDADLQDGTHCRADLPIMVLAFRDNHQAAITIAADETFEFVGPDRDDRFSIVRTRGEEFLAFESDLRNRSTPFCAVLM